MPHSRRRALGTGLSFTLSAALPRLGKSAGRLPFHRLAVAEPPFDEEYEVLIAMAPPLARGTVGKVLTQAVTRADAELKTERLTAALDPDKTRLHQHFVQAVADTLGDTEARLLRVPVDAAETADRLVAQLRERAPQADGVLLANVMGRFVALHGLSAYAPGVIVGAKAMHARTGKIWLEQIYTAGFRGIDPRASHLEVVDMPERFDNVSTLLLHADRARDALIRGVEAIGAEVGRRLLDTAR
jgi:hypothetical protein